MTLRCVNCTLRIDRIRRHRLSEASEQALEIVRRWIYPRDWPSPNTNLTYRHSQASQPAEVEESFIARRIVGRWIHNQKILKWRPYDGKCNLSAGDCLCHACWELLFNNQEQQPPASLGHTNVCTACGRSILRIRSRIILRTGMSEREMLVSNIIAEWISPRQLQATDEVCIPCWLRAQRVAINRQQDNPGPGQGDSVDQQTSEESGHEAAVDQAGPSNEQNPLPSIASTSNEPSTSQGSIDHGARVLEETGNERQPGIMLPTIRRAAATARRCLFMECDDLEKLSVPDSIRKRVLADFNFYIPINARICAFHLRSNLYHELYTAENALSNFTASYVEDMVFLLRNDNHISFSEPETIDDHLFMYWFGRTKQEYSEILRQVPRLNNPKMKTGLNALLCKMRTGDNDERISALFKVPRRTLEGYMDQVRTILTEDYVPQHLGIHHLTREEAVARNTYLADHLFGNPEDSAENRHLIVIVDGTYLNTQKSSNYAFQKNTYSLHKFHNLVKPFLIVSCDGYIIDALGPYAATKNDASIIKDLLESNYFSELFREDDIFILDRGFRDCVDDLIRKGFQAHMPETIVEGERQLTTLQANITRCVTMNRWVVEAVNGRFSRDFKIFRADFLNIRCPHIMTEFKIAAAFLNNFAVQFVERQNVEQIIDRIQEKIFEDNELGALVQQNNLNMRQSMFQSITEANITFPELSMDDLKLIALGTYQIRQARSYVGEHLRAHGMYRIDISSDRANALILSTFNGSNPYILRTRIKSRHVSSRSYYTYIVVERGLQGLEAILAYYCFCAAGKRTVGCCSHVMSVLWYMGFARHQENVVPPAAFLDDILIM